MTKLANVTINKDESLVNYNFAELGDSSLSGVVWHDDNDNAIKDTDEKHLIGNVTIALQGTDDSGALIKLSTTTNTDGSYLFKHLRPGDYQLSQNQPITWADGKDAVGSAGGLLANDEFSSITLAATTTGIDYNFGEQGSKISGFVYRDQNNDGLKGVGEIALSGVKIDLFGTDKLGAVVSRTINTDNAGFYQFFALPASNASGYKIQETQPSSMFDGKDSLGSLGGVVGNDIFTVTIATAAEGINYNFGEGEEFRSEVSGYVYLDNNNNGLFDNNEEGVSEVSINLTGFDKNGSKISLGTKTNIKGYYYFANLVASNHQGYLISEEQPAGYSDGQESQHKKVIVGSIGTDSIGPLFIGNNDSVKQLNFGEHQHSGLSGHVYIDWNNDGLKQTEEPGINAVTLILTGKDQLGNDVNNTVLTNELGIYSFIDILPSDNQGYKLTQQHPTQYLDGFESKAGQVIAKSDTNDSFEQLIIVAGKHYRDVDFGEYYQSSVAGQVYIDRDNNGLHNSTEIGIAKVVLNLTGTDHFGKAVALETLTDADGRYIFDKLIPSNASGYQITAEQPAQYADGFESIDNLIVENSNNSDVLKDIQISLSSQLKDHNFGELYNAKVSGEVFVDDNDDGHRQLPSVENAQGLSSAKTHNDSEQGIHAVTIKLQGNDYRGLPVSLSTLTDEAGHYLFDNLPASDTQGYQLIQLQPGNYIDGLDSINGELQHGSRQSDIINLPALSAGTQQFKNNFAELVGSNISGLIWADSNNNGQLDADEPLRIAGVTLHLQGTTNFNQDINLTVVSNNEGQYQFTGLVAGTYSIKQEQPSAWQDGKESLGNLGGSTHNDQFTEIPLINGQDGVHYNFAERGARLSGQVFSDLNDDGIRESNEAGIPEVVITIAGTDIDGQNVSRLTTTGVDGSYLFVSLPIPSSIGYTVTEQQPENTIDGKDTIGTLGGVLANDEISQIIFSVHPSEGLNYNFAEQLELPASIQGQVWLDTNHNRIADEGNGQANWQVDLIQHRDNASDHENITPIATVESSADGRYEFKGLSPGLYEVQFRHAQGGILYGTPVSSFPEADTSKGTVRNLKLLTGAEIIDQNLPIDPSGIVYDSQTRQPVSGAKVRFSGPAGFNADRDLVGGEKNLEQITGDDGYYQFLLFNSAPKGTYTLALTEPAGYLPGTAPSMPSCTNSLTVVASNEPALVHYRHQPPNIEAPLPDTNQCPATSNDLVSSNISSQYYLSFDIDPQLPSANVVNNHLPVQPYSDELISIVKTTVKKNVMRGELVPYQLTVSNNNIFAISDLAIIDQLPPGFKYVSGSAKIDGKAVVPSTKGRDIKWPEVNMAANQRMVVDLITVVGAGVREGKYVNQAWVVDGRLIDSELDKPLSNVATAAVQVVPDPIMDCSDLTGKVFDDANVNGYQDQAEAGLAGVRLATARGLLVTTDAHGRFHVACAAIPNEMRGANFIIKVDERTLPSGYRITTENPRVIRLTRGKLSKVNFGATIHKVIRVELNEKAFTGEQLTQRYQQQLNCITKLLQVKPAVLRIAYQQQGEGSDLVAQRIAYLTEKIEKLWQACDCNYPLVIEEEVFQQDVYKKIVLSEKGATHE